MRKVCFLSIAFFLVILFTSCLKEKEGSLVFWFNQSTAQWLYSSGVPSLTYYVDGEDVGGMGINVYFSSAPRCGETGTITVVKSLGKEKSKTFPYEVKDSYSGKTIWKGNVELEDGKCTALKLSH